MASEWGPFHGGSHSARLVMTFTTQTHTLMGPVTAVTFAGAGPQTGRRGPREPQAAIVLSPRKPASLCQTCFSVCFLFYVFNVGKGECVPTPPPPLLCAISPNTHLPPPPTDLSTFVSTLNSPLLLFHHCSLPYFESPLVPPGDHHL